MNTLPVATRTVQSAISWAVSRAMTTDQFDTYAVSAKTIDAKPAVGTVTLANGQRRHAEQMIGNQTSDLYLSYRTPAGHWRRCNPTEESTFVRSEEINR